MDQITTSANPASRLIAGNKSVTKLEYAGRYRGVAHGRPAARAPQEGNRHEVNNQGNTSKEQQQLDGLLKKITDTCQSNLLKHTNSRAGVKVEDCSIKTRDDNMYNIKKQ